MSRLIGGDCLPGAGGEGPAAAGPAGDGAAVAVCHGVFKRDERVDPLFGGSPSKPQRGSAI